MDVCPATHHSVHPVTQKRTSRSGGSSTSVLAESTARLYATADGYLQIDAIVDTSGRFEKTLDENKTTTIFHPTTIISRLGHYSIITSTYCHSIDKRLSWRYSFDFSARRYRAHRRRSANSPCSSLTRSALTARSKSAVVRVISSDSSPSLIRNRTLASCPDLSIKQAVLSLVHYQL